MAVNWRVEPTARLPEESCVTTMEDNVTAGTTTGKPTTGLDTPDRAAVILVFPAATPVAKPAGDMVAVAVLELAQVTLEVMFAVELSE